MRGRLESGYACRLIGALSRPSAFVALIVLVWLLTSIRLLHSYWYATALAFPDIDDAMRLAQLQDFLNGQGWFDLHQARLSPPHGYESHWSRLIDAGLAGTYFVFRMIVDATMAERLTRAVWPLLWILPAIIGASAIAWRMAGMRAAIVMLVLVMAGGGAYHQFRPGTIDHHNVQIALTMLAVAATVWSDRVLWCAGVAGALTAFSLAIGLEALPYLAVCGSAIAIRFVFDTDAARALRRYALSLAIGLIVLFFATVASDRWLEVHCDVLAFNLVAAIAPAAAVLAVGPLVPTSRMVWRATIVLLAALVALTMVFAIQPRCLLGPYALVDPRIWPLWLSSVFENQPLTAVLAFSPFRLMPILAFPALCLVALIVLLNRVGAQRDFAVLTICAVFLTAWLTVCVAIRATPYAIWVGFPVMAAALTGLFQRTLPGWARLTLALLLSPFALATAVSFVLPANALGTLSQGGEPSRFCRLFDHIRPLADLSPGLVATNVFHGAHILALTPHRVLAAPYHRNLEGGLMSHRILAAPPDEARDIARQAGVTYIVLCGPRPPDGLSEAERQRGLWAYLEAGAAPDWLEPIASTIGRPFTAYRVLRESQP